MLAGECRRTRALVVVVSIGSVFDTRSIVDAAGKRSVLVAQRICIGHGVREQFRSGTSAHY